MDIVDEASAVIERVRSEGVRRVAAALAVEGEAACIGCGDEIEPDRRAALPSARRCVTCQGRVERRGRLSPRGIE
jgi:phage/conjugal plasmid C-4 type zinc finger TraR family protein